MHQGRLRNLLEFGSPHLCILTFALCLMPYSAKSAPLKAGVAKVDITPPTGVLMWGYFDRLTPAKATLDPLYARVLVLETGEARLDAELRYHLERLVRESIAAGMEPREARRRARLEFGGVEQIKEDCRDVQGRWLEDFWKDLRYTARTLRRMRLGAPTALPLR